MMGKYCWFLIRQEPTNRERKSSNGSPLHSSNSETYKNLSVNLKVSIKFRYIGIIFC